MLNMKQWAHNEEDKMAIIIVGVIRVSLYFNPFSPGTILKSQNLMSTECIKFLFTLAHKNVQT